MTFMSENTEGVSKKKNRISTHEYSVLFLSVFNRKVIFF